MAPLLMLAVGVLGLVVLPRSVRPAVVVGLVALETALVVRALTGDPTLVIGASIVGALTALLVREIAGTFRLLAAPVPEARRRRTVSRREDDGEPAVDERELRRRAREERRRRDRLAA